MLSGGYLYIEIVSGKCEFPGLSDQNVVECESEPCKVYGLKKDWLNSGSKVMWTG